MQRGVAAPQPGLTMQRGVAAPQPSGGRVEPDTAQVVELDAVGRSFAVGGNDVMALADVSLTVSSGEFLVVLGPSGSGKSTLLATLVGLVLGRLIVAWMVGSLLTDTIPELGVVTDLSPASVVAAATAGIAAIALGPLFTVHRPRRMDVPAVLRVVE